MSCPGVCEEEALPVLGCTGEGLPAFACAREEGLPVVLCAVGGTSYCRMFWGEGFPAEGCIGRERASCCRIRRKGREGLRVMQCARGWDFLLWGGHLGHNFP